MNKQLIPGLVSVVASVYNGERYLRRSLESVLNQQGVDLELIVVDDGSTDSSPHILRDIARQDNRVQLVSQDNQGLTASLIRGCEAARGEFIARHDADDVSLPGRLAAQVAALRDREISLVSCWGKALGPCDELLLEIKRETCSQAATIKLRECEEGPVGHGSVIFRKVDYEQVGGYRREFRFAQDWDLWLRLTELGRIVFVPFFGYAFRIDEASISATKIVVQRQYATLARQCAKARFRGEAETPYLRTAEELVKIDNTTTSEAFNDQSYFVGRCLLTRRDSRAVSYFQKAVQNHPKRIRPRLALTLSKLLCRRSIIDIR